MRRVRYQVACSLDGYIAGPDGDTDWIVDEPEIDFDELFDRFDTLIMGRRTYMDVRDRPGAFRGKRLVVFSRTLRQEDHPGVTIVADRAGEAMEALRAEPGKDIWLFGGGGLLRSLLELGQVHTIEPAFMPVVLGGGLPFLAGPPIRRRLTLTGRREYPSGVVWLEYAVEAPGT